MQTKFKVGDRVTIGPKPENFEYGCSGFSVNVGQTGTVKKIENTHDEIHFYVQVKGQETQQGCYSMSQMIPLGSKAKIVAAKPVKFALQYELEEDPTEYFATMPEVKARIKELASRSDLKRDKIFLHTLAKTQKVELGTSITIRKA